MSRKWQQVKRWDDEHLTGPLRPIKWVLRLFSSVLFGVSLLVIVALYGALASLPVGLLVNGLTWGVYGLTLVAAMGLVATPAVLLVARLTRGSERGWRFFFLLMTLIAGAAVATLAWHSLLWPALRYEPVTGEGFRVLGTFADRYADVTVRRLPAFEMTELEFYSWWPLRVVLVLFVMTMIVSTIRRIAFNLPNLGVLTVHTGIILLGLGSMYYGAMKLEGDVLLLAGPTGPDGLPTRGPPQAGFYDRGKVALWVSQGRGWDQRLLGGVPRYNEYNLRAGLKDSALEQSEVLRPIDASPRTLDLPVPKTTTGTSDLDIRYRVVGYAPYAEIRNDWNRSEPRPGQPANPLRFIEFFSRISPDGQPVDDSRPLLRFFFVPGEPRLRLSQMPMLAIEYRMGLDELSWREFTSQVVSDARHALAITMPGQDVPTIFPVVEGQTFEWDGMGFEVEQLLPEPPFPIITPGYENTTSSVAIVRITSGDDARTRWVYSRFPEISQDLFEGAQADGRPDRQAADETLVRVRYLDLTGLHVVIDEREDGRARVAIRQPGNTVLVHTDVPEGPRFPIIEGIDLRRSGSWQHAERFPRPIPVPEIEREGDFIGTHDRAMLAVEVSLGDWSRIVWLPFMKYLNIGQSEATRVELPDGRIVRLAFARARRTLPGFQIRMMDFEMVAYDHRGAPRDYQSTILVEPSGANQWFTPYTRKTQLNEPLRAPFIWSEERSMPANVVGFVGSRLDPAQFKFAQAGWDAQGWEQTQAMADRGLIPRPYAQFTILLVGNNPGIHVIALGGVLMGIGTPWAFYIKPWMLKRRKEKLAAMHAARAKEAA
ncbi:MAG: hypothetical protein KIT54_02610 [Phycisphaeraceae bacterium]|nr:hypothetical protein [Phycisphaeraceae bacterium]